MFPCFHNVNKARVRCFHVEKLAVNIITFCKTTDECRNENTKALHEELNIQHVPRCLIDCQPCKTHPFSRIHHSPTGKQNAWFGGPTALTIHNTVIRLWRRFTDWHTEEGSSLFQGVRKFQPELRTRRYSSVTLLILPKLLNMEVIGSSETTRNLKWREEVPPKLRQISTRNLRNYGKYLPETWNGGRRPPKCW